MESDDSVLAEAEGGLDMGDAEETLSIHFNWSVDQEILLFEAMIGHKPVGVDKNIHMMCIHKKLNSKWKSTSKQFVITPEHIWAKLGSMYDLEALNDSECVPFPQKNEEFTLPNEDFGSLMNSYPTSNSGNSSRSSTVDREAEDDSNKPPSVVETTSTSDDSSAPSAPSSSNAPAPPPTPVTPTHTPTPGAPGKPGRKRSKASTNGDAEKTPSGPSSAKRSRR